MPRRRPDHAAHPGGKSNRMHYEDQPAPLSFKHGLHLPGHAGTDRHHDRGLQRFAQRVDMLLCFVIQISHGQIGAKGAERRGPSAGYRLVVRDSDNQALLSFQQLRLNRGNQTGFAVSPSHPAARRVLSILQRPSPRTADSVFSARHTARFRVGTRRSLI